MEVSEPPIRSDPVYETAGVFESRTVRLPQTQSTLSVLTARPYFGQVPAHISLFGTSGKELVNEAEKEQENQN